MELQPCELYLPFNEHECHETYKQCVCGLLLVAVGMCFGYHLVADYIEHCAAGKSKHYWQELFGYGSCGISYPYSNDFKHGNGERYDECAHFAYACKKQRGYYDHAFGYVLQGYAECHRPCVGYVFCVESHAGSNAFGEFVKRYGHDKQHDAAY